MSKIIKTDCNAGFWITNYTPDKIIKEYIRRWNIANKSSFEEFYNAIRSDENREWWCDLDMVDRSYLKYLGGEINSRYPHKLKAYPYKVYEDLMNDVNSMIRFNG